jgi:NIMA (never in mitosis gene a)-related kinase
MPLEDFHVIAKLGSGVYSSVYKVRRALDGQFYALKKVKLASLNQKEK